MARCRLFSDVAEVVVMSSLSRPIRSSETRCGWRIGWKGLIAGAVTGLAFVWIVGQPEGEPLPDERSPLET